MLSESVATGFASLATSRANRSSYRNIAIDSLDPVEKYQ